MIVCFSLQLILRSNLVYFIEFYHVPNGAHINLSPQRLVGKVYTHFSDKFMRSQMDTVIFPTLESLET